MIPHSEKADLPNNTFEIRFQSKGSG
jgi:hypothetical protein